MVKSLMERPCRAVTRHTTNTILGMKPDEALQNQHITLHLFETAREAEGWFRTGG